ncbi:MAG: diguanylate cyclase protein [Anaerocolumna sp.]|jgi:diguanylate cyclase (GGDEF)-like protein|nr:diguanylate cyclase protein [Anaerocolumna sp.]
MGKLVDDTFSVLELNMKRSDMEFNNYFINFFQNDSYNNSWTILIWNNKENKVIYDSHNLASDSWETTLYDIKSNLSSYRIIRHGDKIAVFGVSKSYINDLVKTTISYKIRKLQFEGDSYIWVNEILNYQGGKNFAIRRIHPSLPEEEGRYLSTDITDMKGNLFYITELQGINKYGELFFSYYFKELHSNMVSEKLTYAKLYKDFNWVIAMGTYQKDIQSYIDQTNKESKALASRLIFILGFLFIIIMVISYAIVMFIEKLNYRHSKKLLESEINQDSLTKADSRRNGTKELNNAFKEYRKNGTNAGIMMFDIDYFKNINDTYGHAVGDLVLVEIVNAIYRIIRSSDKLIRWGGDEFIVIFYGLQVENAIIFGNKILSVASSLNVSVEGKVINPTLSIGFSYFKEMDTDFLDVLKRVDQALYESKTKGRNQVSLLL